MHTKRRFIGLHLRVTVISCHIQVFRSRSLWKPAGITQYSLNWVCRYWVFCCIYAFPVYFSGLSHSPWSWLSFFILSASLLSLCLWHQTGLVEGKIWKEIYLVPLMCRAFFIDYEQKLCLCIPKLKNTWLLFPASLWEQALTSFILYNLWYFL